MSLERTVVFWPPVLRGLVDQEPPQGWVFLIILMTVFNNICQLREQPPVLQIFLYPALSAYMWITKEILLKVYVYDGTSSTSLTQSPNVIGISSY